MKDFDSLPEIDLSPLWNGEDHAIEQVAREVQEVFTTVGMAYLVNHGVPTSMIRDVFAAARAFHALPMESKMDIKMNSSFRGYAPLQKASENDAFVMIFDAPEDHAVQGNAAFFSGPNQWPDGLPEFRGVVEAYRDHMLQLSRNLLHVFSVALGLPPNALDQFTENPTYVLRLQRYPVNSSNPDAGTFGLAPHTDYGIFTMVAQSETEGLEVMTADGEWLNIPYHPDTFILNSGDALKRWSNDIYLSNPHRVVNRSKTERYSVPFFFEPDMCAELAVLDNFVSAENAAKYSPIMYADYVVGRLEADFGPRETW